MRLFLKTMLIFLSLMAIGTYLSVRFTEEGIVEKNNVTKKLISTEKKEKLDETKKSTRDVVGGWINWIGKSEKELEEKLGRPSRIDDSEFNYQWWVYNQDITNYLQFAVLDGQIVSIFTAGEEASLLPFSKDESIDEIKKKLHFEKKLVLERQNTQYQFELTDEDLALRPIIQFGNVYAQLYIDDFSGTISGIRFLDAQTLIFQKPYKLIYAGILDEAQIPKAAEWEAIENANRQEIIDITNVLRYQHGLSGLLEMDELSSVAKKHSQDMYENRYFSHVSPDQKDLTYRLDESQVAYSLAGENIAAKYTDAIAVVHGWLNSAGHRENLLNDQFSYIGVGVFRNYFTQNFIEK